MFLEKWYGDIVENGQAKVHYRANLRLGPFNIGYTGLLQQGQAGTNNVTFGKIALPSISNGDLFWPVGNNNSAIMWSGAVPRQQQLMQTDEKLLTWDPIVLNSEVLVNGHKCARNGYAERLTLNFAPWQLGLKTLRWGRFCGKNNSLVWIEWEGKITKKLALLNGCPITLLAANQKSIIAENAHLIFDTPSQIVSEQLGSGALKALGLLRMFAAQYFLAGTETKWISAASLEISGGDADHGYAVYEEVVWP